MAKTDNRNEREVAELIAHLGSVAFGEGFVLGLTPAQWTAVRFFSRANRFSRTASAFAEYNCTTRGTASQTIKRLMDEGYLRRTRSLSDKRSARLDITKKANTVLAHDPFVALVQAAEILPKSARSQMARHLERMLGHVAQKRQRRPFGACPLCKYLEGDGRCRRGQRPYACGFMGERLELEELEQICINFEPGAESPMKRAFGSTDR